MTDKILEVRGLTKTYGGEKKPGAKQPTPTLDVLKGIDIDIYRGDVVCLIGQSHQILIFCLIQQHSLVLR